MVSSKRNRLAQKLTGVLASLKASVRRLLIGGSIASDAQRTRNDFEFDIYAVCSQERFSGRRLSRLNREFLSAEPFSHVVIDDFLPHCHASFLAEIFPSVDHPVWLNWRKRSPHQYGKQGPGNADSFHLLDPQLRRALQDFNSSPFLRLIEQISGIDGLIPDPYFTGGGMHQILRGGILDVHTDFNYYERTKSYRVLNVLIYLTSRWEAGFGGELEFWNTSPLEGGTAVRHVAPLFNRAVIFRTDKRSFHGHTNQWQAPDSVTRRSIALYYYTSQPIDGGLYDQNTNFMGVASKDLSL